MDERVTITAFTEKFESQVELKMQNYFMKVETEQRYVKILIIFR